jgi:hypothetical protein
MEADHERVDPGVLPGNREPHSSSVPAAATGFVTIA